MSTHPANSEGVFAHWPNRITAVRFVGSLALFALFALIDEANPRGWMMVTAFWLFIGVAFSDALDGWMARKYDLETAFGRIADPFCDKVLILGSMVFLAVHSFSREWMPAWIVVVVLAREFLVTGIRGYVESLGMNFGADWFGKIKMIAQSLAVGFLMGMFTFPWNDTLFELLGWITHALVWITLLTSVGSGYNYVRKTQRLLSEYAMENRG